MKQAVTAVLVHENEIFIVKRQNYLKAFPGYSAFPGGKVDSGENSDPIENALLKDFDPRIYPLSQP